MTKPKKNEELKGSDKTLPKLSLHVDKSTGEGFAVDDNGKIVGRDAATGLSEATVTAKRTWLNKFKKEHPEMAEIWRQMAQDNLQQKSQAGFYDASYKPTTSKEEAERDKRNYFEVAALNATMGSPYIMNQNSFNYNPTIANQQSHFGVNYPLSSINFAFQGALGDAALDYGLKWAGRKAMPIIASRMLNNSVKPNSGYYSISSTPYLYNPDTRAWDYAKFKDAVVKGSQDFRDWMNSPVYREAAEQNVREAEQMGLHYTPTYNKPEFHQKFPVSTEYKPDTPYIGGTSDGNGAITYNLASNLNPEYVLAHEFGHSYRYANPSNELMVNDTKTGMKEWQFLKTKSSKIFKPDSDYAGQFDLSVNPPEAAMNARDIGKDLGLKIGQEYPGYEKAYQIITNYPKNDPKSGLIQYLKLDKESMPYVWKSLTGTLFAVPIIYNTK